MASKAISYHFPFFPIHSPWDVHVEDGGWSNAGSLFIIPFSSVVVVVRVCGVDMSTAADAGVAIPL